MTRSVAALLLCVAHAAYSLEYRLQFPISSATVIGYGIDQNTVTGVCSYVINLPCSGRGCRPRRVQHDNTCTWDLYGTLLSTTPGAPTAPPPLTENGTEIIYATSDTSATGVDTRGFGFVDTVASHYSWQGSGETAAIGDQPTEVTATLLSDGDVDLSFVGANVATQVFGAVNSTAGGAAVTTTTCGTTVPVGTTCTVTVTYDPTSIACTASPYGYAYTGIDLGISSDTLANADFVERFTVMGVPLCGGN
jgi:hypothetical protein